MILPWLGEANRRLGMVVRWVLDGILRYRCVTRGWDEGPRGGVWWVGSEGPGMWVSVQERWLLGLTEGPWPSFWVSQTPGKPLGSSFSLQRPIGMRGERAYR